VVWQCDRQRAAVSTCMCAKLLVSGHTTLVLFPFLDLEIRTRCVSGQPNQPQNNKLYYVPKIAISGLLQQIAKNEQHYSSSELVVVDGWQA